MTAPEWSSLTGIPPQGKEPISVTSGLPAGYFRTTPGTVLLDNTFDVTQTLNFGYAPLTADFGVVYGAIFADHNHDGDQDGGEDGLPGVTISATAAATSPVLSGDFGLYTLRFNDSGTVAIEEINPPGLPMLVTQPLPDYRKRRKTWYRESSIEHRAV